jgi:hypothetical protein
MQGLKSREQFGCFHNSWEYCAKVKAADKEVGEWTVGLVHSVVPVLYRYVQYLKYPPEDARSEKELHIAPACTRQDGFTSPHHYQPIHEKNIAKPEREEAVTEERVDMQPGACPGRET